jgi:hypothetical protein
MSASAQDSWMGGGKSCGLAMCSRRSPTLNVFDFTRISGGKSSDTAFPDEVTCVTAKGPRYFGQNLLGTFIKFREGVRECSCTPLLALVANTFDIGVRNRPFSEDSDKD